MNSTLFVTFLQDYVKPNIRRLRIQRPLILMDNARPHKAHIVTEFIATTNWEVLKQDPYSPDEQPCDIDAFNRLKLRLRGRRLNTPQELISAFDDVVTELNNNAFTGITHLETTWLEIIENNGDYVV